MADTFVWGIAQLERKLSDGVVYTAHWTVTAIREVTGENDLTAGSYGSIGFGDPDPDNFTPYEDLTEGQVVGWVLAALGDEQVETICNGLSAQLDTQENPIDACGIPW
jgi:sugar lactone lactonase YvrE